MFAIGLKRTINEDGTVRYGSHLVPMKFSDHVKYQVPVTSNLWSFDTIKELNSIPSMYSPLLDLKRYMDSPHNAMMDVIFPKNSRLSCTWNLGDILSYLSKDCKIKNHAGTDTYNRLQEISDRGVLTQTSFDLMKFSINSRSRDYNSTGVLSFWNTYFSALSSSSDIVPIKSSYSDIYNYAMNRLKNNWTQLNITSICASIENVEMDSFSSMRKAIYSVKPELKGTLKKIEDINDLDPSLFSLDDFSKEEYEYAIIGTMLKGILLEEDFLTTSTVILKSLGDGQFVRSNMGSYINNEPDVVALLSFNHSHIFHSNEYNPLDHQVLVDPGLELGWITQYIPKSSKNEFRLYPIELTNNEIIAKLENIYRSSFASWYSNSSANTIKANSGHYSGIKETSANKVDRDRDRIIKIIDNNGSKTIPLELSADEIDKLVIPRIEGSGIRLLAMGKSVALGSNGYTYETRFMTKLMANSSNLQIACSNSEIEVNDIRFSTYYSSYEPMLRNDPTIAEIKEMIRLFGYSASAGNKDEVKKRLAEVMSLHYNSVKDIIPQIFSPEKMIIVKSFTNIGNSIDISKMIDRSVAEKLLPGVQEGHQSYDSVLNAFIHVYINMHTYAGAIFSHDYENRLTTPNGYFNDLVMRTWGGDERIVLMEASGIGSYE
jgi:hypothetical protein